MFEPHVVSAPPLQVDATSDSDFRRRIGMADGVGTCAADDLEVPKAVFLRWLTEVHGFLLHGSNATDIELFEPRAQTDAEQRAISAVFATADGIWPMYFAIVDRSRRHSLRNGFWRDGDGTRHYHFAVGTVGSQHPRFVSGAVYVLSPATFAPCLTDDGEPTEEWLSPSPVRPLMRVLVEPSDFPFLDDIRTYDASGVFGFCDALHQLEQAAVDIEEAATGLTLVVPEKFRPTARMLLETLPELELADVTAAVGAVDESLLALRLDGPLSLLRTLRSWARLPA